MTSTFQCKPCLSRLSSGETFRPGVPNTRASLLQAVRDGELQDNKIHSRAEWVPCIERPDVGSEDVVADSADGHILKVRDDEWAL